MRREVGSRLGIARSGLTPGGWKFRRFWAGLGWKLAWNREICWRVGGTGIVRTGGCGDFATACGRRYGGNRYGGNCGGRRLILGRLRVRRAGLHDRRWNRKRLRKRKRRRWCHAGEVRPAWRERLLIQWLQIRGRIGKVERGSREAPLLGDREKWGARSTARSKRNGGSRGGKRLNRKRRRGCHTGEVRSEWLRQRLEIQGRIGKGRCGNGNTPLLENREKRGARK